MGNYKAISLSEAYQKVLNGTPIEDTGLDSDSIHKLELFIEYADCDILQKDFQKIKV